jgi:hypothetical protein
VANDAAVTVTEADVRALAAKLKGLHALLTPAEQMLLHAVLRRAAGRSPRAQDPQAQDIERLTWAVPFNPFPDLDVVAADEIREQLRLPPPRTRGDQ